MNKLMKILSICLSLLLPFLIGRAGQLSADETDISASDILSQVENNYSSLKSYKDKGSVETSTHSTDFETYYVSPNLFLFKWITHMHLYSPKTLKKELRSRYYAVWSNNTGAYSHYRYRSDSSDGLEKEENLGMAVAGATGISSGAAHKISSLMIKGVGGWKVTNLESLSLSGDKVVNGTNCYHIAGKHPKNSKSNYELWIDKNDFLIKQIKHTSPLGVTETTYMDILTNKDIPISVFNFEDHIKQVAIKKSKKGFFEVISSKFDYLLAYIRSRNIEPRGEEFDFSTTTKVKTKNYKEALFESRVRWVIVDPVQYEQNLGDPKLAQTYLNDVLHGAINYALAFCVSEKGVGTEIDKENIDVITSKCNETLRKYKFGIELTEIKSKYISISELSDR
ncbi:MAG: hypothetical protein ACFFDI_30480 [Promethearchaeota archaeon]